MSFIREEGIWERGIFAMSSPHAPTRAHDTRARAHARTHACARDTGQRSKARRCVHTDKAHRTHAVQCSQHALASAREHKAHSTAQHDTRIKHTHEQTTPKQNQNKILHKT